MQINGNGFRAAIGAANRLNTGIDVVNAWAVETILTFILVLVVFSATDSAQAVKAVHLPVIFYTALSYSKALTPMMKHQQAHAYTGLSALSCSITNCQFHQGTMGLIRQNINSQKQRIELHEGLLGVAILEILKKSRNASVPEHFLPAFQNAA